MQLTDAEIRQILIREKKRKLRKRRRRRRMTLLVVILLIIAMCIVLKIQLNKESGQTSGTAGSAAASDESAETDTGTDSEDALSKAAATPRGVIFIDPGHGGSDPGSDNGARYEKDDTLRLALAVRDELVRSEFEVHMSRETDENVDRVRRGEMANECSAQLMISIHRNKSDGSGDGVEAYIPSDNNSESRMLAENIVKSLAGQGFTERSVTAGTLKDPAADYDENSASKMPSCLVEVGFISNSGDNKRFDKNLDQNAKAIADAIESTFRTLYEAS